MTANVDVITLYRTMRTKELRELRRAFELDKADARRLSTVSFCEQRIAWIDEVLRERDVDMSLESFVQRGRAAQEAVDARIAEQQQRGPLLIEGNWHTRQVLINGAVLDPAPSQRLWNHSPDGFNWGYAGSGPAQLALAILLQTGVSDERAVRLHQAFKFDFIASLPQSDFRVEINVAAWIEAQGQ